MMFWIDITLMAKIERELGIVYWNWEKPSEPKAYMASYIQYMSPRRIIDETSCLAYDIP